MSSPQQTRVARPRRFGMARVGRSGRSTLNTHWCRNLLSAHGFLAPPFGSPFILSPLRTPSVISSPPSCLVVSFRSFFCARVGPNLEILGLPYLVWTTRMLRPPYVTFSGRSPRGEWLSVPCEFSRKCVCVCVSASNIQPVVSPPFQIRFYHAGTC